MEGAFEGASSQRAAECAARNALLRRNIPLRCNELLETESFCGAMSCCGASTIICCSAISWQRGAEAGLKERFERLAAELQRSVAAQ